VEQDTSLGDATFSVTGKVKNISNDTSTAFIHFKFIDKSGEVLGNVECNSADLEPGPEPGPHCIRRPVHEQVQQGDRRGHLLAGANA
jgi:hypothetical protein